MFDIYVAYQLILKDDQVDILVQSTLTFVSFSQISPPLAAILALTQLIHNSDGI